MARIIDFEIFVAAPAEVIAAAPGWLTADFDAPPVRVNTPLAPEPLEVRATTPRESFAENASRHIDTSKMLQRAAHLRRSRALLKSLVADALDYQAFTKRLAARRSEAVPRL